MSVCELLYLYSNVFWIFFFQFSRLISSTAAKLQDLIQSGVERHEAWNQCTVQLVQAAKVSNIFVLI